MHVNGTHAGKLKSNIGEEICVLLDSNILSAQIQISPSVVVFSLKKVCAVHYVYSACINYCALTSIYIIHDRACSTLECIFIARVLAKI